MILVDTSVWIDHLRLGDDGLVRQLEAGRVVLHPFILGELALGTLRNRHTVLELLGLLPRAVVAADEEVMGLIEREGLHGIGIGFIDAHLLAATRLTVGARLWTRDKRLDRAALRLSLSAGFA
ncbi:type II toxin-antitoxin system VapC family toxin [Microvirga pudoricolor]|uniref:type II toxin-antitoxin system VapC family toxin n=1 Tax=Microvirga pudoricolor TaxID=2778729 RepID=UPI00194E6D53|nr:type II toxin-antitoxin system VapC family toxin [Microvirga pudoricolor]MBM6594105.1 type II toxin-antitoxin system VapC family toxin [Microvirga pudoricolor]